MSKALIYGDVGGHADLFEESLIAYGCDTYKGTIPEATFIVQVGDLVDRGPASDDVLALVSKFIENDHWIQLVGNHEARFLGGPQFETRKTLSEPSAAGQLLLQEWWKEGLMSRSVGITRNGMNLGLDILVTHAGLTFPLWMELGKPDNVVDAVDKIHEMDEDDFFAPGRMLDVGGSNPGPVWASTWDELIVPWYVAVDTGYIDALPFSQIHGHDKLFSWGGKTPKYRGHPLLREHAVADAGIRHSGFIINGKAITQVDTGLGLYGHGEMIQPLILHNTQGLHYAE
jgi:hypothetical protein